MTPEQFLATHRVFTRRELLAVSAGRSPATVDRTLVRWRQQRRIEPVKRGLFVHLQSHPDLLPDFPLLAARMAPDAAAAYHTALEVHGWAQSLFERFFFVTWTGVKAVEYRGRRLVPVRPRAQLLPDGGEPWIEIREREGHELRVTGPERTVVDVLDRPELAGGIEEVWRSLDGLTAIDPVTLVEYVRRLGGGRLASRVGYFLESRREDLAIPQVTLDDLQAMVPEHPVYLERARGGRLDRRWRLFVPDVLIRSSEEADT